MIPWQVRRDEMAESYSENRRGGFGDVYTACRISYKRGFDAGRRDTLTEEQVIKDLVEALKIAREHAYDYITYMQGGEFTGSKVDRIFNETIEKADSTLAAYNKLIKGEE